MNIGAHVSIAGNFSDCLDRISDIGGNCLMTFASSPRALKGKAVSAAEIEKYKAKKAKLKIGPHFFHGVYLVNLAAEKKNYIEASIDSLVEYQHLAGEIEAVGTIFHIGSHTGRGFDTVKDQIVRALNWITDSTPKGVKIILENSAGQSGTIGSLEEIAELISRVGDKSKIGVCLDTQHAFAAGIPLENLLTKFDQTIGLKFLTVIHCNDSKSPFNSHLDRHENLGEGEIDSAIFKKFLKDPRLKDIPLILEVPGKGDGPTKKDIDTLKLWVR